MKIDKAVTKVMAVGQGFTEKVDIGRLHFMVVNAFRRWKDGVEMVEADRYLLQRYFTMECFTSQVSNCNTVAIEEQ